MGNENLLKLLDEVHEVKNPISNKHERVLLIDGLNLFFRNFAILNMINAQGAHIGGLGGFIRSLGTLIKEIKPTSVYIIFDGVGSSSSRKNMIPEYKSGRNINRITNWDIFENIEEEYDSKIDQIVRLIQYLEYLPVKTISLPKAEADDVIAFISNKIPQLYSDSRIYIVSSDKDYLQLINNNIIVYRPTEKEYYTSQTVIDKYNITPHNFILYKTLLGDNSDSIKGIKGLGEKGILKKFPELKEKNLALNDIFNICEDKLKNHIIYPRILSEKVNIENRYKVMDLSNPLLNDNDIILLNDLINKPTNLLNIDMFTHMYKEDDLGKMIKNVNFWLKENFDNLK
jgi:DNA polymerase-1